MECRYYISINQLAFLRWTPVQYGTVHCSLHRGSPLSVPWSLPFPTNATLCCTCPARSQLTWCGGGLVITLCSSGRKLIMAVHFFPPFPQYGQPTPHPQLHNPNLGLGIQSCCGYAPESIKDIRPRPFRPLSLVPASTFGE